MPMKHCRSAAGFVPLHETRHYRREFPDAQGRQPVNLELCFSKLVYEG